MKSVKVVMRKGDKEDIQHITSTHCLTRKAGLLRFPFTVLKHTVNGKGFLQRMTLTRQIESTSTLRVKDEEVAASLILLILQVIALPKDGSQASM